MAQLSDSTAQLQQDLQQAQRRLTAASNQHQQEASALQASLAASQQELQDSHAAHHSDQQAHTSELDQLQADFKASQEKCAQRADEVAELHSQLNSGSQQQAAIDALQQQHQEALTVVQASLKDTQKQHDAAKQEIASLQQQLESPVAPDTAQIQHVRDQLVAATAQLEVKELQHSTAVKALSDEVSLLKQELRSRESTPDSVPGDVQQQLDSARADAAKQASKLAQAEMRASLVRQQLQVLAWLSPSTTCAPSTGANATSVEHAS